MSRKKRYSKGKKINPIFFIFCEGKTEEAYSQYVGRKYRIHLDINIAGHKINNRFINSCKNHKPKFAHKKDETFLLYDGDDKEFIKKLIQIPNTILLISNPSIEYWFLLHYKNQTNPVDERYCIKELEKRNKTYKKGYIDEKLKKKLDSNENKAIEKAKGVYNKNNYNNPCASVFRLIDKCKELKKEKLNTL